MAHMATAAAANAINGVVQWLITGYSYPPVAKNDLADTPPPLIIEYAVFISITQRLENANRSGLNHTKAAFMKEQGTR